MPPDYSGQNLRGRSFKGQNLTGANFSKADIRGANFTNAILKDANFRSAKAGLQTRWVIGLLIVSWLLAIISGYLTSIIGILPAYFTETETKNPHNLFTSIIYLIVVAGFFIIAIRKGFTKGLAVSILFISLIVASVFITFFVYNNALSFISFKPIALSFLFVVPIVVAIAITFSFSLAFITASVFIFAGDIAYLITWYLASFLILSLAISGNLVIGVIALLSQLGIYIGLDSVTFGYRKDTFIRSFAIAFATNPSCGLSIDTACDHSIHAIAYNKVALVRSANVPMPLLPVF
ncbi:MAG: pentapeptide repeat-containing protein, partial [Tolypothrix carrinoi HA7290-LM1]|nr:pentapeptide repeat-containing protein [Tolypothrix carrinoi HA7290-LM1]